MFLHTQDKSLTEEIKANLNPDVLGTNSSVNYEREGLDEEREVEMRYSGGRFPNFLGGG
jgi:hypothetical protein